MRNDQNDECDIISIEKTPNLEKLIINYLRNEGLSPFSAKVCFGYLSNEISKEGGKERFNRVTKYILNSIQGKRVPPSRLQRGCPNIIPELRAKPFWDINEHKYEFPWVLNLENKFQVIKDEFMSLVGHSALFQPYRSPKSDDSKASDHIGEIATDAGAWNVCYLYLHGLDFDKNLQKLPILTQALSEIQRPYHHAFLSALVPGTKITPHYGPTNKKLRCHFPILIPDSLHDDSNSSNDNNSRNTDSKSSSKLYAGDEERELKEGKCVIFDDSFIHSSCNEGKTPRVVLIFDVWHPDLTQEEIKFLSFINNAQLKAAQKMKKAQKEEKKDSKKSESNCDVNESDEEDQDFLSIIQRSRTGEDEVPSENIWGTLPNAL